MNKKLFIKFMGLIVLLIMQITLYNNFVSASAYQYRLSDKGGWMLLKEAGFEMDKMKLTYGGDYYDTWTNETLQLYLIRFADKTEIQFQCDKNGYPIVCALQFPKNNITGMMSCAHMLIYYFQEAYIRNGQYLNEQLYRAITQATETDYPFPEINAIYYFRGIHATFEGVDVYRLVIVRSPR